jgi:hypothetical protein
MIERKTIKRFKFTLHNIEGPSDHGNVNGYKINIKCIMDNVLGFNGIAGSWFQVGLEAHLLDHKFKKP